MNIILISEIESTIGPKGELIIPADIIEQMGLHPNDSVYVSYIADDGLQNHFREFMLSPRPLDEIGQAEHIAVPTGLLLDANIPADAKVQIVCADGAIILCRIDALQSKELSELLQSLDIANDLLSCMPRDSDSAIAALQQYIEEIGKGETEDD